MNPERSDVETESLRWVARLGEGELPEHREAFERWREEPGHAAAYAQAERLWRGLDRLALHPDIERLTACAVEETAPVPRRFRRLRPGFAAAASIMVCVLATAAFVAGRHYTPTRTYQTDAGQRSTIALEDGSQVVLNFATELDVKFADGQRLLKLRKGEALFTVAEDSRRPFRVLAGDGEVTALGTRFQVRNEARRVTVTLLEGKVAVERGESGEHVQLNPGDQVRFLASSEGMSHRIVDPEAASSWTTGRLKFRLTPLAEVLEEVNRYSRTKIHLKEPSMGAIPINGAFEAGDSGSVVSALELMLPLEAVTRAEHDVVLIRREGAGRK